MLPSLVIKSKENPEFSFGFTKYISSSSIFNLFDIFVFQSSIKLFSSSPFCNNIFVLLLSNPNFTSYFFFSDKPLNKYCKVAPSILSFESLSL